MQESTLHLVHVCVVKRGLGELGISSSSEGQRLALKAPEAAGGSPSPAGPSSLIHTRAPRCWPLPGGRSVAFPGVWEKSGGKGHTRPSNPILTL